MAAVSVRLISPEALNPQPVTEHGDATSIEFGRLVGWRPATTTLTFFQAGTEVFSETRTFELQNTEVDQLVAQATAVLQWQLRERLAVANACDDFAALMHGVTEVESVVSASADGVIHIWTYLDSNPFDTPTRYRIYAAEQETLRRHPGVEIEFHLINLAEYPEDLRADLRATGTAIHKRRG